jgi:predicted ribosomally synthesized peptide with SipW-like signal peptide
MLIGTTFAWFTDSVTSANNIIKSGNLDVELYYQAEGQTDWTKVTENTNVFKEDTLWEPGHTEVVKLKVVNEGSLALKYNLGVNVASEVGSVNVKGEAFKLSDYIKFGIVDGPTPAIRRLLPQRQTVQPH